MIVVVRYTVEDKNREDRFILKDGDLASYCIDRVQLANHLAAHGYRHCEPMVNMEISGVSVEVEE